MVNPLNPTGRKKNTEETKLPRFECTKCGACCRDEFLLVTVTGSDIVRIAAVLGLSPNEMLKVLDFYVVSDGAPTPIGLDKFPSVATEGGLSFIALKKMENGECIFLKENLCMIHPVRPAVCRSFPFVFDESDGQRTWGLSAKKEICPGLGTGPQASEIELEELADTILPDIQLYREFAKQWNDDQLSPTALDILKTILSDTRFYS